MTNQIFTFLEDACCLDKDIEMGILRWMCGHTMSDKIQDEVILEKVEVASVAHKMRETKLMYKGGIAVPIRMCEKLVF